MESLRITVQMADGTTREMEYFRVDETLDYVRDVLLKYTTAKSITIERHKYKRGN